MEDFRNYLIQNGVESFENARALDDASTVVQAFCALNMCDDDRPAKRRKTFPEPGKHVSDRFYERLVMKLNGSSQESPVYSLHNVQNVIRYVPCNSNPSITLTRIGPGM